MPEGARRLAAIVFTDIVGFATMAQADEAAALRLLDEQRALLRPLVSEHGGRVIKTLGDGFLLEFPSAVESVRCARKIQDTFHQRNESAEAHRKIVLRVGIHVGDILGDGEDIAGDAVNVAARLEPLADPGGICVSGQVIDHIRNKLPVAWQQLAAPRLKNIEAPIEVYRLHAPSDGAVAEAPGPRAGSYVRMAVLPFASLSPDPSDEFFADGLTEEVITRIAQGTVLRVVARTSVMQYKGARKGIREIGRELGVGSILEGSVRRSANTVRITVQLVDAVSEEHLWAGRFDRELTDIFALQDEIARGVSRVLQGKLVARTPPAFRSMRRGQPATPRG